MDHFIIRDADSRLSRRDFCAVEEWLKSGKMFHVLRDHPSHSNFPISGGLWGGNRFAFKKGEIEAALSRPAADRREKSVRFVEGSGPIDEEQADSESEGEVDDEVRSMFWGLLHGHCDYEDDWNGFREPRISKARFSVSSEGHRGGLTEPLHPAGSMTQGTALRQRMSLPSMSTLEVARDGESDNSPS